MARAANAVGPLDLDNYVTEKTPDGLFAMIGQEKQSIRQNPAARSKGLLKKYSGELEVNVF